MPIVGDKTYLTCVSSASNDKLREWRNSPEIKQFMREYREISEDMQKAWFETNANNDTSQLHFEIHDKETDTLIGHCSLTKINWVYRNAEFGVLIGDKSSEFRGYGSDALKALIRHGFYELGFHRIYGEVYSNNQRALSAFYKIGFVKECMLRKAKFINGSFYDTICISILEDEWRKLYGE